MVAIALVEAPGGRRFRRSCLFGITFDAVDLGDEFEGLFRFGVLSLLEDPASCVSHASCTQSASRLGDSVV
ncbi:MAG TPA: hypothetical protein VM580_31135, partial [Labilithrix sp.]|nr:hypothetical protein [Labilithrix sp.]